MSAFPKYVVLRSKFSSNLVELNISVYLHTHLNILPFIQLVFDQNLTNIPLSSIAHGFFTHSFNMLMPKL